MFNGKKYIEVHYHRFVLSQIVSRFTSFDRIHSHVCFMLHALSINIVAVCLIILMYPMDSLATVESNSGFLLMNQLEITT